MPTFIITMNWTEQGMRNLKDAPKRAAAARELGKKLGVEIKHLYMTSGKSDLMAIVETLSGDNVAKFCMVVGGQGNVRTSTVRDLARSRIHENDLRAAVTAARPKFRRSPRSRFAICKSGSALP